MRSGDDTLNDTSGQRAKLAAATPEPNSRSKVLTILVAVVAVKFSVIAITWGVLYYMQGVKTTKPNFVWIYADDLGYHDIGLRNEDIYSPTLDKLATDGVIFMNQYVQSMCTPSRHALMTGRYPFKSEMQSLVITPLAPECSGLQYKYLPHYLKELGYSTHAFGKWHLGYCREECLPTHRGFDSFLGIYDGAADFFNHTTTMRKTYYDWQVNDQVDFTAKGTHAEELLLPAMVDIIDGATPEHPFFLYLAPQHPHTPLQPTDETLEIYKNTSLPESLKAYYALITGLDNMVKAIKDKLDEKGLMDNTYIIFLSDNGADVKTGSNEPFRGIKGTLWEGGSKSSSFIYSPLLKRTAYEHYGLIHVTDWMSTIISLAGGEVPESERIDGIDQTDMITEGKNTKRINMVYNIDREKQFDWPTWGEIAVRDERFKLIWGFPGQFDGYGMDVDFLFNIPQYMDIYNSLENKTALESVKKIGSRRYKFTEEQNKIMDALKYHYHITDQNLQDGTGFMQLFDLKNDPSETTDLSKSEDPDHQSALGKLIEFAQTQFREHYTPYTNLQAKNVGSLFDVANQNGYLEPGGCEDIVSLPES